MDAAHTRTIGAQPVQKCASVHRVDKDGAISTARQYDGTHAVQRVDEVSVVLDGMADGKGRPGIQHLQYSMTPWVSSRRRGSGCRARTLSALSAPAVTSESPPSTSAMWPAIMVRSDKSRSTYQKQKSRSTHRTCYAIALDGIHSARVQHRHMHRLRRSRVPHADPAILQQPPPTPRHCGPLRCATIRSSAHLSASQEDIAAGLQPRTLSQRVHGRDVAAVAAELPRHAALVQILPPPREPPHACGLTMVHSAHAPT